MEPVFAFERDHPDLFTPFTRLIPMGNRAEEYFVIWWLVEYGMASGIRSQDDFDRVKSSLPKENRESYAMHFYRIRAELQDRDPERWAQLLPPFDGIPEAVRSLADRFDLAIATSKDMRSVRILLHRYGILDLFTPDRILDKDFSYSKKDHLSHFHLLLGIPFNRMHFIDDKVLHLSEAADLGVNAILAMWGFNTEREHDEAKRLGYGLLSLEDLKRLSIPE